VKVKTQFYMISSCSGSLKGPGRHITQHISIFLHCMAIHNTVRHFTDFSTAFYLGDELFYRLYRSLSWWLR